MCHRAELFKCELFRKVDFQCTLGCRFLISFQCSECSQIKVCVTVRSLIPIFWCEFSCKLLPRYWYHFTNYMRILVVFIYKCARGSSFGHIACIWLFAVYLILFLKGFSCSISLFLWCIRMSQLPRSINMELWSEIRINLNTIPCQNSTPPKTS